MYFGLLPSETTICSEHVLGLKDMVKCIWETSGSYHLFLDFTPRPQFLCKISSQTQPPKHTQPRSTRIIFFHQPQISSQINSCCKIPLKSIKSLPLRNPQKIPMNFETPWTLWRVRNWSLAHPVDWSHRVRHFPTSLLVVTRSATPTQPSDATWGPKVSKKIRIS